jgi:hypothetical protein
MQHINIYQEQNTLDGTKGIKGGPDLQEEAVKEQKKKVLSRDNATLLVCVATAGSFMSAPAGRIETGGVLKAPESVTMVVAAAAGNRHNTTRGR